MSDKLLDILTLSDDWDGLGSAAPTKTVFDRAVRLMDLCRDQWRAADVVRPTPDGLVCFEWREEGLHVEAEIDEDEIEFMILHEGHDPVFQTVELD